MTNNYTIVLFLLFLSFQAWATTDTDSLTVGKRTRTFATATYRVAAKTSAARGAVSIKGGNSGGEIITTKGTPLRTAVKSRSFGALGSQISKNYKHLSLEVAPAFTEDHLWALTTQEQDSTQSVEEHLAAAQTTFQALDESGNWIEKLEPSDLVELPVGIRKTIGNVQYMVGISGATFTPEYTEPTAFVRVILPLEGQDGNFGFPHSRGDSLIAIDLKDFFPSPTFN